MPRSFTDAEREQIRARLLEAGQELLTRYGPRRTSVEDLTRAAGISKGALYLFYPSKEELFLEILEAAERRFREAVFQDPFPPGVPPRQALRALIRRAVLTWKREPLLRAVGQEAEYHVLMARLAPERIAAHRQTDEAFAADFVARWSTAGALSNCEPRLFSEAMRALFFVSMHEEAFEADTFPQVIDLLIDAIAARFTPPENCSHADR